MTEGIPAALFAEPAAGLHSRNQLAKNAIPEPRPDRSFTLGEPEASPPEVNGVMGNA